LGALQQVASFSFQEKWQFGNFNEKNVKLKQKFITTVTEE